MPATIDQDRTTGTGGVRWDEQHPRNADGTWMGHCTVCGLYLDDYPQEPPADLLCDDCVDR